MLLFLPKNAYRIEMETDQGNSEFTKQDLRVRRALNVRPGKLIPCYADRCDDQTSSVPVSQKSEQSLRYLDVRSNSG